MRCGCLAAQTAFAQPASTPSLEQRVADLEAYVNNSARPADAPHTASNVSGPGPGHNAWVMTATACSGAVGGLVVITPACGYVDPTGAIIVGVAAGIVPFFACTKLKSLFHYDDALDTFGIHAVGGTLGAFLTGLLATARVNSNLSATVAAQNGLASLVGHCFGSNN